MADIKQIKIGNTPYNIRDTRVRVSDADPGTRIAIYDTGIASGNDATGLSNLVKYTFFGLISSSANNTYDIGLTSVGSGHLGYHSAGKNNVDKGTGTIHTGASGDTGTSYILVARLDTVADTVGTCKYYGKSGTLSGSGVTGLTSLYLKQVGGLF